MMHKIKFLTKMEHLKQLGQKDELIHFTYEWLEEILEDKFSDTFDEQNEKKTIINHLLNVAEEKINKRYLRQRSKTVESNEKRFKNALTY